MEQGNYEPLAFLGSGFSGFALFFPFWSRSSRGILGSKTRLTRDASGLPRFAAISSRSRMLRPAAMNTERLETTVILEIKEIRKNCGDSLDIFSLELANSDCSVCCISKYFSQLKSSLVALLRTNTAKNEALWSETRHCTGTWLYMYMYCRHDEQETSLITARTKINKYCMNYHGRNISVNVTINSCCFSGLWIRNRHSDFKVQITAIVSTSTHSWIAYETYFMLPMCGKLS